MTSRTNYSAVRRTEKNPATIFVNRAQPSINFRSTGLVSVSGQREPDTFEREAEQASIEIAHGAVVTEDLSRGGSSRSAIAPALLTGSAGQPLSEKAKQFFEPRFGHSFESVRVHHDDRADSLSQSLGALAFTTGDHIFFRSGRYDPENSGGRELLSHELAHVLQPDGALVKRQVEPSVEVGRRDVGYKFHQGLAQFYGNRDSIEYAHLIQALISDPDSTPNSIEITGIAYAGYDGPPPPLNTLALSRAQAAYNDVISKVAAKAPEKAAVVAGMFISPFSSQIRSLSVNSTNLFVMGAVMRVPRSLMKKGEKTIDKKVPPIGR